MHFLSVCALDKSMQKYNNFTIVLVMLLPVLLGSCAGNRRSGIERWRQRRSVVMSGTRFEAHIFELFYRGRPLPGGIEVIVCPLGRFYYRKRILRRAGFYGWINESSGGRSVRQTSCAIPVTGRKRVSGSRYWYRAVLAGKRVGTPAHWIWVRVDGRGYWMEPNGMDYFVSRWGKPGRR